MPKATVGQTGFTTGEVSPLFYGATDNPRYKKGMETMLNYLPTLQGPMIRRPATKNVTSVKDSLNPPVLIPFKFSAAQNYMLEFGDKYIRFFSNNGTANSQGPVVTSGTTYKLTGNILDSRFPPFYATRATTAAQPREVGVTTSTTVTTGSILELVSPYAVADVSLLRWSQKNNSLYIFHPRYPTFKLSRQTQQEWKIEYVFFLDGPYLPANSYAILGDNVGTQLHVLTTTLPTAQVEVLHQSISGIVVDPVGGIAMQITTSAAHGYLNGTTVFIQGVVGTTEANNYSAFSGRTVSGTPYWTISVTSATTFLLVGSAFINAYSSGGAVAPALFGLSAAQVQVAGGDPTAGQDQDRTVGLVTSGVRFWGNIVDVYDAATINIFMGGPDASSPVAFTGTFTSDEWFLGAGSGNYLSGHQGNGFPAVGCFHQDRLVMAGIPNTPQEIDGSVTGSYEYFKASEPKDSTVIDSDAYSFVLASEDSNPIRWLKSTAQALVAGTYASEWSITPSGASEAITSTNVNAQQSSYFGSANLAAVQIGNAVLYIQRAARKLREMAFFFMAGTFRSTDLTEISEHITLPSVIQIDVQKETQPLIWALRADGVLTSLIYNRDDVSLSVGWSRHILGGQSDAGGSPPIVLSIGFIPDPLVSFDQMWMVVKRRLNGAVVCTIEYMTKISDDSILAEDSFQGDCGATFDNPKAISGIASANPTTVIATAHGFSNGDSIKITDVVGMNETVTDINGYATVVNLVNEKTFVVAGVATNSFVLHDFSGNAIDSTAYSAGLGGNARKLVTTISGLTWLENETVGVLADGGNHPDCVVSNSGSITLNYPAAKVQIGYRYPSQGKVLRAEAGSADGTSIGKTRRTCRVAMQLHRCGTMSIGTSFNNLIPIDFAQVDQNQADIAVPLASGIYREGLDSAYDFESQLCFQQNDMLPGTIQSISTFMEEQDV